MRKLSIVLLLIGISFMTIEANNLSVSKSKRILFERWKHTHRTPVSIPIEAILDENSIEVHFLQKVDNRITFQVKNQQGNILFQDVVATSNELDIYKIDLHGFPTGQYELLYIDEEVTLIGDFEIEQSIP